MNPRTVKIIVWAAVLAPLLAFGLLAFGQPATQPATQPTTRPAIDPPFIIAVWQQPPESFDKWTARGVNTFMGATDNGGRMSKGEWEARFIARKGNFITYAGPDVDAESRQPGRVGWHQLDESDASNHVDKPGNTPADHRAAYDRVRATGLPMYTTLAAFDNEWYDGLPKPLKTDGSKYGHRASSGGWMDPADVIGWDFYLWTNNRPGRFDVWERLMDRAHAWSGGKPQIVFIETTTQGKGLPYTADQFESEVWKAVDYCKAKGYRLRGVVYFSHSIYPGWTSFDITPPDIAARMPIVNAKLVEMFGKPGVPPVVVPPADPAITALQSAVTQLTADNASLRTDLAAARAETAAVKAGVGEIQDWIKRAPVGTTQPSTRPTP